MIAAALLACALNVAPVTLDAVIRAESGGNPLALHVNKLPVQPPPATSVQEVAAAARRFMAAGYTVDLGVMQINSRNLPALGYTIEDALAPCANVRGGAAILAADYAEAVQHFGEGQQALLAALSAYNTGSLSKGFRNGYVSRVAGIPSLSLPAQAAPAPPNPYTADTVAYSREATNVRIE